MDMPYNWNRDYVPSKADRSTDILGQKEIGGVGQPDDRSEGIMICCLRCGAFLIRRNGRQEYCDKPDCQTAWNAKNQREFRRRKRQKTEENTVKT